MEVKLDGDVRLQAMVGRHHTALPLARPRGGGDMGQHLIRRPVSPYVTPSAPRLPPPPGRYGSGATRSSSPHALPGNLRPTRAPIISFVRRQPDAGRSRSPRRSARRAVMKSSRAVGEWRSSLPRAFGDGQPRIPAGCAHDPGPSLRQGLRRPGQYAPSARRSPSVHRSRRRHLPAAHATDDRDRYGRQVSIRIVAGFDDLQAGDHAGRLPGERS